MPKVSTTNDRVLCLVVYKDGKEEEMELPVRSNGELVTTSLPNGAVAYRQSFVCFPGSGLLSFGGSHKLPQSLTKIAPVYDAVGRIGVKQSGVPTGAELMFGTGTLVSRKHVLTNLHVASKLLSSDLRNDCGIEFGAEKGSVSSNFVKFSNEMPKRIAHFDAAILTLAQAIPVQMRPYVSMTPYSVNSLKNREIVAIGYPKNQEKTRKNLIRATKRVSHGSIFKHSTSKGDDITISIDGMENGAICHSASTLGGSSGSAIVDVATGDLVGLHFSARVLHNNAEDVNLAIPATYLSKEIERLVSRWL